MSWWYDECCGDSGVGGYGDDTDGDGGYGCNDGRVMVLVVVTHRTCDSDEGDEDGDDDDDDDGEYHDYGDAGDGDEYDKYNTMMKFMSIMVMVEMSMLMMLVIPRGMIVRWMPVIRRTAMNMRMVANMA